MSNLANQQINNSFNGLLQVPGGITSVLQTVQDGNGNPTGLQISSTGANVTTSDTFVASIDGVQINGVIPRLISDGFGDCVSVKDFGAIGDGITDDTTAIQAAITSLNAGNYKSLYFPAGNYRINNYFAITASGVSIIGDGPRQSVIKQHSNVDTFVVSSTTPSSQAITDVSFINLGIDYGSINNPYSGVAININRLGRGYFNNIDIRNVFQGMLIVGSFELFISNITITATATWSTISTNSFLLKFDIGIYTGTNIVPSEIFINNFNLKGPTTALPYKLQDCIQVFCADGLLFSNGHVGFCNNNALNINPQNIVGASIINLEFSNVYFDGSFGGNTSSSLVNINGSTTPTTRHIKFNACVFANYLGSAIIANLAMRDLRITNCEFSNNGYSAIDITNVNDLSVIANTFIGNNAANAGSTLMPLVNVERGIVTDNMFSGGAYAHPIAVSFSTCRDFILGNNICAGASVAYHFTYYGNARFAIKNNQQAGSSPTVTSIDNVIIPMGYDCVFVTGNGNVSTINASPAQVGVQITFLFTGTPTWYDGLGNMKLAGNFVATANSTLTLIATGTEWTEVCRAIV